ncbi:MAG: class I SAM-dependent methyltransferase [Candidatus Pacebacteria bacterium]|nr:class I SAM-dependent methyltransferase [Candidatus Paceibacterota bacterium]
MKTGYLQYRLFKLFYQQAADKMCNDFKDYISLNANVLDLGCGSGILAKKIEKKFKANIQGVDVVDMRVNDVSLKIYNGSDLSFISDNEFDTVLISYVLHHTENPESILKQAKRITKKNIIIFEDMNEGLLGKIYCYFHGRLFDFFFLRKSIPAKFFNEKEWKEIFNELGLKIVYSKSKKYFLNPVKRKMFVLEKMGV